ncbi:hypothetical protein KC357_g44 [Hortaea werneckii]|nr:hypothetical protein KC357_g44 [Hortaea werneckii]
MQGLAQTQRTNDALDGREARQHQAPRPLYYNCSKLGERLPAKPGLSNISCDRDVRVGLVQAPNSERIQHPGYRAFVFSEYALDIDARPIAAENAASQPRNKELSLGSNLSNYICIHPTSIAILAGKGNLIWA